MSDTQPKRPGVGCGAAILRDGRLLLVKRQREPEAGHWGLPGGKIDWGETARAAVAREIEEEVGLTIQPGPVLCIAETIDRGDGMHWVAPVYLIEDAVGEARLLEPEKMAGVEWFALDALPSPLTDATRAALKALGRG